MVVVGGEVLGGDVTGGEVGGGAMVVGEVAGGATEGEMAGGFVPDVPPLAPAGTVEGGVVVVDDVEALAVGWDALTTNHVPSTA